jgi:hypothetical protein
MAGRVRFLSNRPFEILPDRVRRLLSEADEENREDQQPRTADQDLADVRILHESSW